MNAKNRKTLKDIFTRPFLSGVLWNDIEALLIILGAKVSIIIMR
jgi:hypothetical protein